MKSISVDTSILVAILSEEEHTRVFEDILSRTNPVISAVAAFETFLVMSSEFGENTSFMIDQLLLEYGIKVVDFGIPHLRFAEMAFKRFGKGNHPAKLNFGDCIVYATAKFTSTPLLYVGDDFSKTDIESVDWRK